MSASSIMLVAVSLAILGGWANNTKVTAKTVVEAVLAVLVIAFLDQGKTEPIAKGFAWLFLVAVFFSNNSPVNALKKVGTATKTPTDVGATPGSPTTLTVYPESPQSPRNPVNIKYA